jgi:hypothetical protein
LAKTSLALLDGLDGASGDARLEYLREFEHFSRNPTFDFAGAETVRA